MMKKIVKIKWSQSVWFFDIDDTLIATAKNSITAAEGIADILKNTFGQETSKKIQNKFIELFHLLYMGHTNSGNWDSKGLKQNHEKLVEKIFSLQKNIIAEGYNLKKWSREILIKIALDDLGLRYSSEQICEAADAYWMKISKLSDPFSDALFLIREIKKHKRPIILVTGSDARLILKPNGQFEYDPKYSEALKRERVIILSDKGVGFDGISIGDPEDKPHLDFFQKAVHTAEDNLGHKINLKDAIMVGDSYSADLQVPKEKMGFGLVVLFEKNMNKTEIIDEHEIKTGRLSDIANFLT